MNLYIDREALDALFPENSEARVQLSRTIIRALLEKVTIKHLEQYERSQEIWMDNAARAWMEVNGFVRNWQGQVRLPQAVVDSLNEKLRLAVEAVSGKIYQDSVEQARTLADETLQAHLKLNLKAGAKSIDRDELKAMVKESLAEIMKGL